MQISAREEAHPAVYCSQHRRLNHPRITSDTWSVRREKLEDIERLEKELAELREQCVADTT